MARIECQKCKAWMSDAAAVCPHCGARQEREGSPDLSDIDKKMSEAKKASKETGAPVGLGAEDAKALLEIDKASAANEGDRTRTGFIESELFPQTRGATRPWETALTVIAAPLIVASIFTVGITLMKFGKNMSHRGMVAAAVPSATFFIFGGLSIAGFPVVPSVTVGVMFAAWLARAVMRLNAMP